MAAIDECAVITQADIPKLIAFHQQHYPGQHVPHIQATATEDKLQNDGEEQGEANLGFYRDGVRRTLTDDQIAMFRHSEIQRLLAERRRQKAEDEERQEKEERSCRRKERQDREHAQNSAGNKRDAKLSYDETQPLQNADEPKKFLWPTLGS